MIREELQRLDAVEAELAAASGPQREALAREHEALLARWTDALVKYQVKGTGDAVVDGGVLCPACNFEQGRIADSVYALVYRWKKTGEQRYLDAAAKCR